MNANRSATNHPQSVSRLHKRRSFWRNCLPVLIAVLGGLSAISAIITLGAYYRHKTQQTARPVVTIRDPQFGEQLEVGQSTAVRALASDKGKIMRVELWVDGQLQEEQTSRAAGGISPFPLLADWQPLTSGSHTLTVRAFNDQGGRAHTSIIVEALEFFDEDMDGVSDENDACPGQFGSAFADGCPDAEGDGIPDTEDACPLSYGLTAGDGCPVPYENDRDGDGVLDAADSCIDDPGSPFAAGCPDADSDGVGDNEDSCPAEAGWLHPDGCPRPGDSDSGDFPVDGDARPDRDGDGVPDAEDLCPDEPGLPWNAGCPESGAGDRDDDGVADDIDLAPDEAGLPEHGGAPPPGEGEDRDDDGIPNAEEPPESSLFGLLPFWLGEIFIPVEKAVIPVEIEVLEFSVLQMYDEIECYARVNDYDVELVTFRAAGENRWDVEFSAGENSRIFLIDDEYPIRIYMECQAYQPMPAPEGNFDLGSFTTNHPQEEWDGRVLFLNAPGHVDSTPGDSGHGFQIQYRICASSCAESPLPPPILTWYQVESGPSIDYLMRWTWDGDEEYLDGFLVFKICEDSSATIYWFPRDREHLSSLEDPPFFDVYCDDRCEYFVRAYHREGAYDDEIIWSAPSSVYAIAADACPAYVLVYFETLPAFDLPPDEGHTNSVGPIYGEFWAESGGERQALTFDISDCRQIVEGRCTGLYFVSDEPGAYAGNRIWDDFFCTVRRVQAENPHCPIIQDYTVPDTNILAVGVMPDEDLTIGERFMDNDSDDGDDVLFEAQLTLRSDEIADGEYALSNGSTESGIRLRLVAIPIGIRPLSCGD